MEADRNLLQFCNFELGLSLKFNSIFGLVVNPAQIYPCATFPNPYILCIWNLR